MNATVALLPPAAGASSHWLVYFTVEDAAASMARAAELGGTVEFQAEIEDGHTAVLADPLGAAFAMFQGEVDP